MITTSTDRIEKQIDLQAPVTRVWRALTDTREFGTWFRVQLEGEFVVGRPTRGRITYPGYEGLTLEVHVERMDPRTLFSFRWHPHAVDPDADYSSEPTTLVEFHLEEIEGGTRLRVIESGFDAIPAERRHEAFHRNREGWSEQLQNIRAHVDG